MLKIENVDVLSDFLLKLAFSDGFQGVADLSKIFSKPPFSEKTFTEFAIEHGTLSWGDVDVSVEFLHELTIGSQCDIPIDPTVEEDMEHILKDALWQSIEENRPDILQAAIAMFVEQYGHRNVIKKAGIKSRTSAYRSLKSESRPKLDTLIKLGNAVLELSRQHH